jgi:hypothetical protein
MKRLLPIAVLVGAVGCYAYIPAIAGRSLTDREVQLALTDSGAVVMAALVGPSIATVDGRFIRDSDDVYLLGVTGTARRDGAEMEWRGERIAFPRVLVSSVATKQFSRGRTLLFGALTTGALIAIGEAFAGGGGATVPGGTPSGPPTGR